MFQSYTVMTARPLVFLSLAAGITALAIFGYFRSSPAMTGGPIPHQAYVWQRDWGDSLERSLRSQAPEFERYVVLIAEVTWPRGVAQIVRVPIDHQTLSKLPIRVGLALRIGTFSGPFKEGDITSRYLVTLAGDLLADAKRLGLHPAELQIDFDCADSKLGGYRIWLQQLRSAVNPVPLTLTVLPSWLKRREVAALVAASDGFVLQVHSFERPPGPGIPFLLCDPVAAHQSVLRAARLDVPFRVALPTYGYTVAFRSDGRFLGLSAEGPSLEWPADAQLREVRARETDMSALVKEWKRERPELMQGVIWYRLPVEGDRMNWHAETLTAIVKGRPLLPEVVIENTSSEPGLIEIQLLNRGSVAVIAPVQIAMRWRGSRLVAADGLAGYSTETDRAGLVQFSPPSKWQRLEPGSRRRIGWARFHQPTEVSLESSTSAR